jgi:hypothetical protein
MQTRWLYRLTYLYLLIPFILFCLGWLRLIFALPITTLIIWIFFQLDRSTELKPLDFTLHPSSLILIFLWVFLSGVGGYAFQNWDHHWRNAVFHDLINFDLPVIYSSPERGPIKMLIYYVGYWLPAAFVGKAFGWGAANFFLFLWTWLGVLLAVFHISQNIKIPAFKATLFLIFFSGMDALGTLLYPGDYPTLLPPVRHLEVWMDKLQYSSFTTQLFWTFNQAIPAWLCIMLVLGGISLREQSSGAGGMIREEHPRHDIKIFAWTLCFFFAPLVSVGLLPYLLIELLSDIKNIFKSIRYDVFFAGVLIAAISYLYFSSNTAAQERGFQLLAIKDVLIFFLLEGGVVWLVLAPQKWRDPRWAVTGVLLFAMPFIQLGSGSDFVMRASIAPLFYLMLMTGEALFQNKLPRVLRITLYALLLIGALTPFYEINRSVYRTAQYYLLDENQRAHPGADPLDHLEQPGALEDIHPNMLVADDVQTLKFMSDELSKNFIANVRQTLYYRYISSH